MLFDKIIHSSRITYRGVGKMNKINKKRTDQRSIKTRLLIILLSICIIPVLVLGIVSYKKAFSILSDKLQVTTQQNLSIVNKAINNYFMGMESTVELLATNMDFQQMEVHPEFEPFALSLLTNVKNSNKDILSVYFAQHTGKMVLYPEQKLPDGFNPTLRPWYENTIKNLGKIVVSEPYKDVATGNYVISISKAVEYNGQVVGAIAMDINLEVISKQLSDIKIGKSGYAFITDSNGIMIAHPDKTILGTDLATKQSYWNDVKSKNSGFNKYVYFGKNKFASYDTNTVTGWKLLASMDEAELLGDTNVIRNLTLIFILGIAVIAVFVSIFVSKSITKHIFNLKELFEKASEGDLSVKVNINSKDEFEDLGNNFNSMLDNINLLIKNVKRSADIIAQTSETVNTMSGEASKAINDVSLTIDQVALGTTSQAQDIGEGVEAINNLAGKIENIGHLANEMGSISNDANKLSEYGLKVMSTLTAKTEEANTSTGEVANVIDDMDKSTAEIGSITETINSIAEQTNLLALNAAIEAARAGESGRGFSVVADEIRKLAEQSTSATKQIQGLVEEIKSKSQLAVKSMHNTRTVVTEQTNAVNETRDIFNKILNSVKVIIDETKEIEVSITDTNKNKDAIVDRMQSISAVSQENSASTEEVSATTEEINAVMNEFTHSASELKELAEQLENEINKFKLA